MDKSCLFHEGENLILCRDTTVKQACNAAKATIHNIESFDFDLFRRDVQGMPSEAVKEDKTCLPIEGRKHTKLLILIQRESLINENI